MAFVWKRKDGKFEPSIFENRETAKTADFYLINPQNFTDLIELDKEKIDVLLLGQNTKDYENIIDEITSNAIYDISSEFNHHFTRFKKGYEKEVGIKIEAQILELKEILIDLLTEKLGLWKKGLKATTHKKEKPQKQANFTENNPKKTI